jgi:hypothetical protein
MSYLQTVAASSTSNVILILVFGIANCIRKRLNKSSCQSHNCLFDCEAQLDDLKHVKHQVTTQRGMIEEILSTIQHRESVIELNSSD